MTGEELLKLQESQVFRKTTMDATINEFVPESDTFKITDAFMPFKLVSEDEILVLIEHGAFGKTNPVNLGSEHKRVALPGYGYREHTAGHWRESIEFNEKVLAKAVNPKQPRKLWGSGLQANALNVLDIRLNNLIEYLSSKILIDHTYSEARWGVNYTYDPQIPAKFKVDVTSSPPWTSGGAWSNAAAATPITDLIRAKEQMARYGFLMTQVWMSEKTLIDFMESSEVQAKINNSPSLIDSETNRAKILLTLTGLVLQEDVRRYAEETTFTAASAIGDTTLNVDDATEFTAGDEITLRNSSGQEEQATIASIASNVLTVGAITKAYAIGDRVTVYKPFFPEDHFVLKGAGSTRMAPNNWYSTPSLIKGKSWTNPLPGKYTWNKFDTNVPYKLEIGAGIDGGPMISACDWFTVKTV